jgi:hypothetical protein
VPNRIIKESICYSEDINSLSPQEEVFFYRLIVNCDDYGELDARIPILKAKLYPLKPMKSLDINRYLMKLASINLIALYENAGINYLKMTNWDKHQQIRAHRHKYPSISDEKSHLISVDINSNQMITNAPVIQSNPIQSESESKSNTEAKKPLDIAINDFIQFRKETKKTMTERAIKLFLTELNKLATDDDTKIKIINQSILKGWTSVYPLTTNKTSGVPQKKNFEQRTYDDNFFKELEG